MKKVLLGLSALAMAFSISSAGYADTLLLPSSNCCGAAAPITIYQPAAPCCQKRIFSYYMPVNKCCRQAPVCCGAAAPVQPCCEEAKPACGCGCDKKCPIKHKKHKKAKKCNCTLK